MSRVTNLAGLPIRQYDSPNKGGAMSGHRGIVLHIAQGYYQGTINWQMNPDQRYADGTSVNTCSTWVIGRERGEWAQMVDTDLIAWCQRAGSRIWLSIELAGFLPAGPTPWQVEACAHLLAWSAVRYDHPIAVANDPTGYGLGHHSMDREWLGEEWGHDSCPGAAIIAAKSTIVQRARALAAGEETDMSLTEPQDNALGEAWATSVALRDGTPVPPAGNHSGGAAWVIEQMKGIRGVLDTLSAKVDSLSVPAPAPVDVPALAAALQPLLQTGVTAEEVEQIVDTELDEQSRSGADAD